MKNNKMRRNKKLGKKTKMKKSKFTKPKIMSQKNLKNKKNHIRKVFYPALSKKELSLRLPIHLDGINIQALKVFVSLWIDLELQPQEANV